MSTPRAISRLLRNEYLATGFILLACLIVMFPGRFLRGESLSTTVNMNANYPWRADMPDFRPLFAFDPATRTHVLPPEHLAVTQIRTGIPPLWNPYAGFGAPLLPTLESANFYPLKLAYYVLPFWLAVDVIWLARLWLSGMGAYVLARTLGIGRWGALLTGVAYMLSGSQLLLLTMPAPNVTALYPWLLAAVERTLTATGRATARVVVTGLFIGAQFLGGWPQSTIHLILSIVVYAIVRAFMLDRSLLAVTRRLGQLAIAGLIGVGLAAIQLLPFATSLSSFSSIHLESGASGFVPISHIASMGVPYYTGFVGRTWSEREPATSTMLFVSATVVILALAAMFHARTSRRLLAVVIVLGFWLWYIMGLPGSAQIAAMPLISLANMQWVVFIVTVGVTVLAGAGLEGVLAGQITRRQVAGAAGIWLSVILVCLGLNFPTIAALSDAVSFLQDRFSTSWITFFLIQNALGIVGVLISISWAWAVTRFPRRAALVTGGLMLAVIAQLWYAGFRLNNSSPLYGYQVTDSIAFLQSDPDLFRISSVQRPESSFDTSPIVAQTASQFGLYDARNVDALMVRRYLEFLQIADEGSLRSDVYTQASKTAFFGQSNPANKVLLDMANVKYLLDFPSRSWPDDSVTAQIVSAGWKLVWDDEMRIYRNPTVMPRAYVTHAAWVVTPGQAADRLADPAFDPRRVTILEDALPADLPGGETTRQPTITIYEPLRVEMQADLDRPGLLVLSDTWFPGWRASLDGGDTTLYRANHNFRAVYVPAGKHKVVFWYSTDLFWLSAVISVVALAGCVGLITIRPC